MKAAAEGWTSAELDDYVEADLLRLAQVKVDFEIEDVVPFGSGSDEPVKLSGVFHPAGSELTVARATRSKVDAFGISYEGNAAFSRSNFSWAA